MKFLIILSISFFINLKNVYTQDTLQKNNNSSKIKKVTLSGYIQNSSSGEELIGALILVQELPNVIITSNEYGFYSLTLPVGNYTIIIKSNGFNEINQKIELKSDTKTNFQITEKTINAKPENLEEKKGVNLKEVVISGKKANLNVVQTTMGVQKIDIQEVAKLPVLFGEKDILKTIQLLPGVLPAGEGNSGFFVRGGTADQNLILLDEANVYNASHLLGFFSTFNSDAIKDATLIKGNSQAQYGGRLASVLDIKMNEGNDKQFKGGGGIGLISSRLNLEGPIVKNKASFMITGRRTYALDVLKLVSNDPNVQGATLYFYDLNAKVNYRINENNRIFFSGYLGRDVLGFNNNVFGINWGNITSTLRWNSIITKKLFSNTSLIFTTYDYSINIKPNDSTNFSIGSTVRDWNLKQDFQYNLSSKASFRFGINAMHHTIMPTRFTTVTTSATQSDFKQDRQALENVFYANSVLKLTDKFTLDFGARLSIYSLLGPGTYSTYNKSVALDTIKLSSNQIGKTYINLEPRISTTYLLNESMSIKAAYGRNTQNLHLLSNSASTNPTDQWIGDSYNIKPEIADQISLGWFQNFSDNTFEFSVETYYKWMYNQIDYKNSADINFSPDVESQLVYGNGRSYGVELYFKKRAGNFTGWISYTLSKTERQIEDINNGAWYPAKQDRTHNLAIVGMYQINQKWNISAVFIFYTGNAVTFPSGKYTIGNKNIFLYTERNGYRMPDYNRLDISATYEFEKHGRYEHSLNFGFYNIYGRENAYSINFVVDKNNPNKTVAEQTTLFTYVPSITYNFKF